MIAHTNLNLYWLRSIVKILVVMMTMSGICYADCCNSSFYDQRYRGWLWFEEPKVEEKIELQDPKDNITPDQARAEIEQFAKELEELKFMMLARPTIENVKAYKDKEKVMWDKGMILDETWRMANFVYPEHNDHLANPTNVHAVKMQRELDWQQNSKIIKGFAKDFDLVLFFKGDCQYCIAFEPVLKHFSQQYGFGVEAVSMDGAKSGYFKTVNLPQLVERLNIKDAPTLVAVSKKDQIAFELIRGFASITELEEYSIMAMKYLASRRSSEGRR